MTALDEARAALKRHRQELLGQLAQLDAALLALGAAPAAPAEEVAPEPRPRRAKRQAKASKPAKRQAAPAGGEPAEGTKGAQILALVRKTGGATRQKIGEALKMGASHVNAEVTRLRSRGFVQTERGGPVRPAGAPVEEEGPPVPVARRDVKPAKSAAAPVVGELRRVVKVEFITEREDRFHCLPLACKLTAGACIDRQKAANSDETGSWTQGNGAKKSEGFRACKSCPLGRQVAARVEAA